MRKKTQHTQQLNIKMTDAEMEQLQEVNQRLTGGQWNKSDLGRFLIQIALDKLATSKIVTKQVVMVDGIPVVEK